MDPSKVWAAWDSRGRYLTLRGSPSLAVLLKMIEVRDACLNRIHVFSGLLDTDAKSSAEQ